MFSCNQTGVDRYCCNNDCTCEENGLDQVISFAGEPYTLTIIGQPGTYPNPSATPTSSSSSSSSSASTTSSSTSITSAGAASTASSTSPASPSSTSQGSSNAVPVGVGVGLGAVLVLGLGAFFFFRRRRSRAQRGQHPISDKGDEALPIYDTDSHPLQATKTPYSANTAYKSYQASPRGNVSELPSEMMPGRHELGGGEVARELPGSNGR